MRRLRTSLALFVLVSSLMLSSTAFAATQLSKEAAHNALKPIIPDIEVLTVESTPLQGIYEITLRSAGKNAIVYMDASGKTAFFGAMIDIATKTNITQEKFNKINKIDFSSIPLEGSIVVGDPKAKYKAVVFDDPD